MSIRRKGTAKLFGRLLLEPSAVTEINREITQLKMQNDKMAFAIKQVLMAHEEGYDAPKIWDDLREALGDRAPVQLRSQLETLQSEQEMDLLDDTSLMHQPLSRRKVRLVNADRGCQTGQWILLLAWAVSSLLALVAGYALGRLL